jgi:putative ABC transport system permease protein
MNIRPTLSALMRNITGPLLLALQVAVTLAVLTNAFYIVHDRISQMNRPTGIDLPNLFRINVRGFGENYRTASEIPVDLATIRAIDGVRAVTSINTLPLSGSGWDSSFASSMDEDRSTVSAALYLTDESGLDALGVDLIAGRGFRAEEIGDLAPNTLPEPSPVVITRALAEHLYADRDPVGQTLYLTAMDTPHRIVGIIDRLVTPWPNASVFEESVIFPMRSTQSFTTYLIRAVPGQRDPVMAEVERVLSERLDNRLVSGNRSLEDIAARSYESHRAMSIILISVSVLLLVVNVLGVIGLASFQVNRRRRQIGTRRALGATRGAIMGQFMTETGLIVGIGIVVGVVLAISLNYGMMNWLELSRLELNWLPLAAIVLFLLGQLAVLGPARRAAMVPPAVATRSV